MARLLNTFSGSLCGLQPELCSLSLEERHGYWEPAQGSAAKKAAALAALHEGPRGQFQVDSTLGFVTARKEGKGKVSASVGRNVGAQTKVSRAGLLGEKVAEGPFAGGVGGLQDRKSRRACSSLLFSIPSRSLRDLSFRRSLLLNLRLRKGKTQAISSELVSSLCLGACALPQAHASVTVQVCTPVSVETLLGAEGCFSATSDSGTPSLMRLPWLPGRPETVRLLARGGEDQSSGRTTECLPQTCVQYSVQCTQLAITARMHEAIVKH